MPPNSSTLANQLAQKIGALLFNKTDEDVENREEHRVLQKMELENCIFERYLRRVQSATELRSNLQLVPLHLGKNALNKVARKQRQSNERNIELTAEQKCTVFHSELEEYKKEYERFKANAEAEILNYKMTLEVLEASYEELKRTRAMFDRYVIKRLSDREIVECPEKSFKLIEKFHRAYINRMDTLVQNLLVNSNFLKRGQKRFDKHLKEFDESNLSVEPLDLKYLRIQCEQSYSELQRLQTKRVRAKINFGKANQLMMESKCELKNELEMNHNLSNQNRFVTNMVSRLQKEHGRQKLLIDKEENTIRELLKALETHKVPETAEYIQKVRQVSLLTRQRMLQERRKSVAQLTLKHHRQLWYQARRSCTD